jgi:hypothetical protein
MTVDEERDTRDRIISLEAKFETCRLETREVLFGLTEAVRELTKEVENLRIWRRALAVLFGTAVTIGVLNENKAKELFDTWSHF